MKISLYYQKSENVQDKSAVSSPSVLLRVLFSSDTTHLDQQLYLYCDNANVVVD